MNAEMLEKMIMKRKSIRSISMTPLSEEVLSDIISFAENLVPLFPAIQTSVKLLPRAEIKPFGSGFAPHYLAIYSEQGPDAELNAGFMLQQADLYLSSKGIGSCWLGMTAPHLTAYDGLTFIVLLAIGTPGENVHRTSIDQFKRKPLEEIATAWVVPSYINAMRLAPSAMNKQPWFFTGEETCCHVFSVRGKGLINIAEGWRFVDLGISMSHLWISALADSTSVVFKREDSIPSRTGTDYVLSCRIE